MIPGSADLQSILQTLPLGIAIIDDQYRVQFWNQVIENWSRIKSNEIAGRDIRTIYPNLNEPKFSVRFRSVFEGGPPVIFSSSLHHYVFPFSTTGGVNSIQHTTVTPLYNPDTGTHYAVFSVQDVSELYQIIEELKIKSVTDSLTGIHNRGYFYESAKQKIDHARRFKLNCSIGIIDIDYFKEINDTHGHQAGDEILKIFSTVIKKTIREYDVFARFGGEEFVLFMDECTREVCTQVLERLKKKVTETPVLWNGTAISYTFSAGVSDFGDFETIDSLDVDEMIRIADSRLYQAKKEGRNRIIDR